jgi:hypothetical protein
MDAGSKRARSCDAPSLSVKARELAKLGSSQLSQLVQDTCADAEGAIALSFPPGASGLAQVAEYIRATARGNRDAAREVLQSAVRAGDEGVVNALGFLADKFDVGCIMRDMKRVVLDVGTVSAVAPGQRDAFYAKFVRNNPVAARAMFEAVCDRANAGIHHMQVAAAVPAHAVLLVVCRAREGGPYLQGVAMVNWAKLRAADARFLFQFFDEDACDGDEDGDEDGEGEERNLPVATEPYSAMRLPPQLEIAVKNPDRSWRTWFDDEAIIEYIAGADLFHAKADDLPTMCEKAIDGMHIVCVLDGTGAVVYGKADGDLYLGGL